jgi:bifunctional NMN adenylyltransferase/nudix hydrolase
MEELQYPENINPRNYNIGVLIGRFQVDDLHDGHRALVEKVCANHQTVILFLGVPVIKHGEENPLDFETRKLMMEEMHPQLIILPLDDQREDTYWSEVLDSKIIEVGKERFPYFQVLLYGSRNSFIPRYSGQFDTCELISTISEVSGSKVREDIGTGPVNHPLFRRGVIYSNHGRYPNVWPCADVVVYDGDNQSILLGRKPQEEKFRFIGGHVDPSDKSYEHAALRELKEEAGSHLEVGGLDEVEYVCSGHINDWRHERYNSTIKSTLYLVQRKWGKAEPNDDIAQVEWFSVDEIFSEGFTELMIVPEHQEFFNKLLNYIKKNKLKN